jgi:hypothetical protein
MYALSRPYPWESQMSSAAVNLISTGKITGNGSVSTMRRSSAKAVGRVARGTAYSISVNRTRRGVQNTSCDRAV